MLTRRVYVSIFVPFLKKHLIFYWNTLQWKRIPKQHEKIHYTYNYI